MKTITISLSIILFIACNNNENSSESGQSATKKKVQKENIVWKNVTVKNLTFQLPSNFSLNEGSSSFNKKVYVAEKETLGLSIDIENLPNGYENSSISDMVSSPSNFGFSINQDNKNLFNDFKLINSEFTYLGNNESLEITQTSKKVSGKNISMIVKAHFTIADPYYLSITFSYPSNSFDGEQTINKIMKSFKFKRPKNKEPSQISNQPNLQESKEWLVNKLSKKIINTDDSEMVGTAKINFYSTDYKNISIVDEQLIFEYRFTAESPSYQNKFKNVTNYKVIIPFNKIIDNEFDSNRTYSGNCKFEINTKSNSITKINLENGAKNFTSYYEFKFDCSEERNLGSRLNKAIIHIKNLSPENNKRSNKLF